MNNAPIVALHNGEFHNQKLHYVNFTRCEIDTAAAAYRRPAFTNSSDCRNSSRSFS
jgi:hypothetical protein